MYIKKTLSDIKIQNKKVILRLDLNVPLCNGKITDKNRITQCLPTITYLLDSNCKVFILSHFSRIKSLDDIKKGNKTLRPVAEEIQNCFAHKKVVFVSDIDFKAVEKTIAENQNADIFVLENTRYYDVNALGEAVKWESKNFEVLAQFWAGLADVYVNDAFGTSHRAHASNVGIANIMKESVVGYLVEKELNFLGKALLSPEKPKVVILGGSKVSDKLKLINAIAPKVDKMIIAGGMSYTFLKSQGKEVGKSIVEESMIKECEQLLIKYKGKLLLPIDHVVAKEFADIPGKVLDLDEKHWDGQMALDIGPKTIKLFSDALEDAKVVIWNGPMGVFEFDNFSAGTKQVALKLCEITKSKNAFTVIGGGDSAAAAAKFKLAQDISFISTGGGASLSFFEGAIMPGLEVIPNK